MKGEGSGSQLSPMIAYSRQQPPSKSASSLPFDCLRMYWLVSLVNLRRKDWRHSPRIDRRRRHRNSALPFRTRSYPPLPQEEERSGCNYFVKGLGQTSLVNKANATHPHLGKVVDGSQKLLHLTPRVLLSLSRLSLLGQLNVTLGAEGAAPGVVTVVVVVVVVNDV